MHLVKTLICNLQHHFTQKLVKCYGAQQRVESMRNLEAQQILLWKQTGWAR